MSHPGATASDRHKVVIIGSGFGGLTAAQKLKHTDVDIKLIAKTTHHLFQPLLYQVATGIISEGEIAPADAADPAQAEERPGAARRGHAHRPDEQDRRLDPARPHLPHAVRQPDHRGRRRAVLLRQRPVRRVRAGHEDDRRRPGTARPDPRRLRAGRAVQRPGAPREAADVRRGRRRADRCRDGRADRGARRPDAQGRFRHIDPTEAPGDPGRRRARGAAADGREARTEGASTGWRRWASRSS